MCELGKSEVSPDYDSFTPFLIHHLPLSIFLTHSIAGSSNPDIIGFIIRCSADTDFHEDMQVFNPPSKSCPRRGVVFRDGNYHLHLHYHQPSIFDFSMARVEELLNAISLRHYLHT
jgi:hypothetical protein